MKNKIKVFITSYVSFVGGIWGFLESYTYFEGEDLKNMLGFYWWLIIYIAPLLFSIVVISKFYTKGEFGNSGDTVVANDVRRDVVNGNVVNIQINDNTSAQEPTTTKDKEQINSPDKKLPEKFYAPIRVTFLDNVQKSVSLSASFRVNLKDAAHIIGTYGSFENAKEQLCDLVIATVLTELERHTLDKVRKSRGKIENSIFESVVSEAREMGFTLHSIKLKQIV